MKNKIFCYRIGSNVNFDRAKDCLAFDCIGNKSRFCGYCIHTDAGSDEEMIIDLDSIYSGD